MSDLEWWEEAPYPLLDKADNDCHSDHDDEHKHEDTPLHFTYLEAPEPLINWDDKDD